MKTEPKILVFDIETSPNIGYTWGKYQQDVIKFISFSQIICIAWKWLGEKQTYSMALPDYKGYKAGILNDKKLVKDLWDLLDKADIAIAHNGDQFDVKVAATRFIANGMSQPSPYASIDTKKIAKVARFPSNKLAELGQYLGEGQKMETGGFGLWEDCMAGDMKAWRKMKAYNKQDVILLENIYLRLRSLAKTHPNLNVLRGNHMECRVCSSNNVQNRGYRLSSTGKRQAYVCNDCGAWSSAPFITANVILR